MRRIIALYIFAQSFAAIAFAQTPMAEPRSVEAIVADIEKQQSVTTPELIQVDKVPPALLEELGDAVMGALIGDPDRHDAMDRALGGDGSPRLTAFHGDLGLQYLRKGGLKGVRFGGTYGMVGDQASNQKKTIEGTLDFVGRNPALLAEDKTYILGFPDFYYYAYTDGIKKDDQLKLEGYLFESEPGGTNPYFAVSQATINGKTYDLSSFVKDMMGEYAKGMVEDPNSQQ